MPIIHLSQDDINRSKQPDAGWHHAFLHSVEEGASKDKQSINWTFDFEIDQGDNAGRHARDNVNSKAVGMRLIPITAALLDIPQDEVKPSDVDTDKLVGKKCWIEVIDRVWNDKIVKNINSYQPDSKSPF